jgi:hypothetical protein
MSAGILAPAFVGELGLFTTSALREVKYPPGQRGDLAFAISIHALVVELVVRTIASTFMSPSGRRGR